MSKWLLEIEVSQILRILPNLKILKLNDIRAFDLGRIIKEYNVCLTKLEQLEITGNVLSSHVAEFFMLCPNLKTCNNSKMAELK